MEKYRKIDVVEKHQIREFIKKIPPPKESKLIPSNTKPPMIREKPLQQSEWFSSQFYAYRKFLVTRVPQRATGMPAPGQTGVDGPWRLIALSQLFCIDGSRPMIFEVKREKGRGRKESSYRSPQVFLQEDDTLLTVGPSIRARSRFVLLAFSTESRTRGGLDVIQGEGLKGAVRDRRKEISLR
ncbi:hypothetical protein KM043_008471 [Ampulex compressa]|nr:hypothetical protein KM043_008471 [Ampulex compressa]